MNSSLPKILVTGGRGQLASALRYHPHAYAFSLVFLSSEELDITQPAAVKNAIELHQPDAIVNTGAYTAVDRAESEIDKAMKVNYKGALEIARACAIANTPLIHLSTDYIFDGTQQIPYTEEAIPNPINVYGQSKLLGEEAVRESCEQHIILRVSGVFSEFGTNFVKTILRLAKEKEELTVVADQITCPTYASDIAAVIYQMLATENKAFGTYHYCSKEPISWHQFAVSIIAEAETFAPVKTQRVIPIVANDYPTVARRPAYSALNCEKLLFTYGIEQPGTQKAIQTILSNLPEKFDA